MTRLHKWLLAAAASLVLAAPFMTAAPARADGEESLGQSEHYDYGHNAPIYAVYQWCDQQGCYVMYSWYSGLYANVYAQNDSDQLNAQGFYTYIATYVDDTPGG
jgi:hypothetical protein